MARLGRRQPNRPIVYHPKAVAAGGGTTPPTAVTAVDLAGGTGTRSFTAVTTQAGDYLVGEAIGENETISLVPSGGGLTYTTQNDSGANAGDVRVMQWTAPDAAGGSRTVTLTATGAGNYRARLTVVRGSAGPGTGKANSITGQTVSVTRQGDDSMMFVIVGDWSAGAVGTPSWTPGGSTVASEQQGSNATYIFGRWDDSGAAGTASHGISSPSYTTPSVAVLEMLGTAAGGTNANAEAAAGTGSAPDAAVDIQVNDGGAAGTGTAPDPTASVGALDSGASGTGTAPDPTVSTANATNAPAEAATGTGTAPDPTAAAGVNDTGASGAGSAPDPTAALGALDGGAAGTGSAPDGQAAIQVFDTGASGSGQALDATVSTAAQTSAPAEVATGTGSAPDAAVAITVPAGAATGTSSALDAGGSAAALADVGSGTGAAPDPNMAVTINAGLATGTGSAPDAVGQPGRDAPAEFASAAGSALDAAVAILAAAEAALGLGVAPEPTAQTMLPFTVGTLTAAAAAASTLTADASPTATLTGTAQRTGGPS